jgi:hypothetical protein
VEQKDKCNDRQDDCRGLQRSQILRTQLGRGEDPAQAVTRPGRPRPRIVGHRFRSLSQSMPARHRFAPASHRTSSTSIGVSLRDVVDHRRGIAVLRLSSTGRVSIIEKRHGSRKPSDTSCSGAQCRRRRTRRRRRDSPGADRTPNSRRTRSSAVEIARRIIISCSRHIQAPEPATERQPVRSFGRPEARRSLSAQGRRPPVRSDRRCVSRAIGGAKNRVFIGGYMMAGRRQ